MQQQHDDFIAEIRAIQAKQDDDKYIDDVLLNNARDIAEFEEKTRIHAEIIEQLNEATEDVIKQTAELTARVDRLIANRKNQSESGFLFWRTNNKSYYIYCGPKECCPAISATLLFTLGSAAAVIGVGTLLHNPHFALFVIPQIPIIMLATLIFLGVLLAAYSIYLGIELCTQPAEKQSDTSAPTLLSSLPNMLPASPFA